MQNGRNHKKIYLIKCITVLTIYILFISLALLRFGVNIWTFSFIILLYVPSKILIKLIANKTYIEILSKEFNSQEFYAAIYQKPMSPPISYRINAEWYIGNYEKLIALSLSGLKNAKNVYQKCFYLTYLARAYFELRDFDNLTKAASEFYELKEDNPSKQKTFEKFPAFEYYEAFLARDFDTCIFVSKSTMYKQNISTKHKLQWLTQKMNYAIALYESGDIESAKEHFTYFCEATPKLNNFSEISKKYIEAIKTKNIEILAPITINVDTTEAERTFSEMIHKGKIRKIILWVCISLIIIGLAVSAYLDNRRNEQEQQRQEEYENELKQYETILNSAISRKYENYELLTYSTVKKDDQVIDTLVLIESQGTVDLLQYVSYDKGISTECIVTHSDLKQNVSYSIFSIAEGYYIEFAFTDIKSNIPNSSYVVRPIIIDGNGYWFYVDYIEHTPRN